jgi:hypothetical protein
VAAVLGAIGLLTVGAIVCAALFSVVPWAAAEYPRTQAAAKEAYKLKQMLRIKRQSGETNPAVQGWPSEAELSVQFAAAESRLRTPTPILPFLAISGLALLVALVVSVTRGDPDLRKRLKAVPLVSAEHPTTFRALAAIAIAAGQPYPPRPFVFEADSVNAAIVGRPASASYSVLVTSRFLELSAAEQRAALANLLSRRPSLRGRVLTASAWFSLPFWWVASRDITFGFRRMVERPGTQTYGERMAFIFAPGMLVLLSSSAIWTVLALQPYLSGRAAGYLQPDFVQGVAALAVLICLPISLFAVKALSFAQEATAMLADNEGLLMSKEPAATFTGIAYATRVGTRVDRCGAYGHLFWCSPLGTSYLGWKSQHVRERRLEELAGVDGVGLRDSLPQLDSPTIRPVAPGEFPQLDAALARFLALPIPWPTRPTASCLVHARPHGAVDACLQTGWVPAMGGMDFVFTEDMLGELTQDELLAVIVYLVARTTRPDPVNAVVEQTRDLAALRRATQRAQAAPAEWPDDDYVSRYVFSDEPPPNPARPMIPSPSRLEVPSAVVQGQEAGDSAVIPQTPKESG